VLPLLSSRDVFKVVIAGTVASLVRLHEHAFLTKYAALADKLINAVNNHVDVG
jgi:hypothetical protein